MGETDARQNRVYTSLAAPENGQNRDKTALPANVAQLNLGRTVIIEV
jgi:hypothetical protein